MLHIVESAKPIAVAARVLEEAAARNKFGVLHVHDQKTQDEKKSVEFPNDCRTLEVCNPHRASRALSKNMAVSTTLPCRISVYEEGGGTTIATMLPTAMLATSPESAEFKPVAEDVERSILRMICEAP